jgi:di/tricarboxylate transporter
MAARQQAVRPSCFSCFQFLSQDDAMFANSKPLSSISTMPYPSSWSGPDRHGGPGPAAAHPCPAGLEPKAWALVAIFLTTIVAIILKVMPIGVMAMMAIVIVSLSQVTSTSSKGAIADALASFSNPLIWLIVVAILISRGLKKTGLGRRIGLMFIALLGKRTIGIGYGLAICELVLAPFTPSNTARGGGIVHPS